MADIAVVFNWPLDQMDTMDVIELAEWRERAYRRSGAEEE